MWNITTSTAQAAIVHRPTDCGIDLPPGKGADELVSTDYRAVEMDEPLPLVQPATVHRPNECGIDLPAGSCAEQLRPTDYRIVEMD